MNKIVEKHGTGIEYEIGDTVEYQTYDGTERKVRVSEKNIYPRNNGRKGFNGTPLNTETSEVIFDNDFVCFWGYNSQIVAINGNKVS